MEPIQYLWKDRKRHLGLPLSFTRYSLSEDRLFCEKGFLNLKCDEVLLYRVRDLQLNLCHFFRPEHPPSGSCECEASAGGQGADP